MQCSLIGDRITGIHGIVNGTCNYILTKLEADPTIPMPEMIADAQRLGYAEPDPTFDVGGHDSAYKIVILASLAFGQGFKFEDVRLEGITTLGEPEFRYAKNNGLSMKLLASGIQQADGSAELTVGPAFVPSGHVVAGVRDVFNAILLVGEPIGETLYYGAGAGQPSTASGLIADLALAARTQANGAPNPYPLTIPNTPGQVAPKDKSQGRHYLRFKIGSSDEAKAIRNAGLPGDFVDESDSHLSLVTRLITTAELDKLLGSDEFNGVNLQVDTHVRFVLEA